ncbi:MAG: hypothetical protein AAGL49_00920, partial [Pseudomonadota bacterium]
HPFYAHASAVQALQAASADAEKASPGDGDDPQNLDLGSGIPTLLSGAQDLKCTATDYGHSYMTGLGKLIGANAAADEKLLPALIEAHGREQAQKIIDRDVYVTMVYPSVLVKSGTQNLRIIRPIAHD